LESELFGYKGGAFTNAVKDKKGLIEEADKGTLFLDEIGEMPVELQAKLLRFLESSEYIKLGDTKTLKVNVRIIAATNSNLQKDVSEGRFREDLFYRLNVYTIPLPALRDRQKDIPLLAKHFSRLFAESIHGRDATMSAAFLEKLQQYDWKGNIRELRNCIERAVIVSGGGELDIIHLPVEIREIQAKTTTLSAFALSSIEKLHIQRVLLYTHNNKAEAARLLNIGLATLYRKIDDYQLQ
jgi:transcriptional regulator with PAS, ATPase and Fis domain